MRVAVVGLGRMGRAIAARLGESGLAVTGFDRDEEAAAKAWPVPGPVPGPPFALAVSPRAAAEAADVVVSIITEDEGVRTLFNGPDGFLSGPVAGKLFIEMSTLRPATGRELAPLVAAAGARLIESPVLGSVPTARAGQLLSLAGGAAEDIDRARKVLDHLARRVVHMGPNGAGYAMKLAANLGLAAYIQGLAKSFALGEREGLTLDQMLEVLAEAPTANAWLKMKTGLLRGEPDDITLDLKTLRKDIMSVVATGAARGAGLPLSAAMLASLSAAVAQGYGENDIGELPRFFREHMLQRFD